MRRSRRKVPAKRLFSIKENPEKGRCIHTELLIEKGDEFLEFDGQLTANEPKGNDTYIFEFSHKGKKFWYDATIEDGSYGRLINDNDAHPNCKVKVLEGVGGKPRLIFYALNNIRPGEEVTYDYGQGPYVWRQKKKKKGRGKDKRTVSSASAKEQPVMNGPVPTVTTLQPKADLLGKEPVQPTPVQDSPVKQPKTIHTELTSQNGPEKDKRTVSSASAKEQPVMNGPVPTVTTLQPKADLLGKRPVQPTPVQDSPVKQPKTIHTELTSQNGPEKDKRTVSSASAKEQPVMNGPVPTVTTLQPKADLLGKEPVQPTPVQDSPVKQPKTIHTELTSQNGPEKDKRMVSSASAKEQPVMNGPVPTVTTLQPKADLLGKEPVQPTPVQDSPVKQLKTIHTELTSQNGPEKDKRTVSSASAKEQPVMNGPVPTVTTLQPKADLLGKEPVQPTPVQDSPVKQLKTIHTQLTSQNGPEKDKRTVSSASAKEQPVMNGPVPTVTTLQPKADLLGKEPVQPTPVQDSPVKQPKTIHTELTSQNGPEKDKRTVSSASAKEQPVMNGPVPTVTTLQPKADLLGKEPVQPTPVQDSPVKQPKTIHTELTSQNGPEKDKRTVSSASAKEQPVMNGPVPTVTTLQPKADLLGKEPVQPTPVQDSPVKQPKTIHTELTSQNDLDSNRSGLDNDSDDDADYHPSKESDSEDLDSNRSGLDNDSDDDADYHPSKESDREESEDSDPFDLDLDKWVSNSEPEESSDFNDMDCLEGSSLLTATAIKEIDGTATLDSDISHQTPMAVSSSETESSTAFSEVLRISNLPRNPEADLDEDTNEETSQKENSKWKPKPDRYCTFCKQVITGGKLKRHMKRKHKLDVAHITAQSKSLQNDYFEKLRKDGIHMYNKILMANKADPKMRERMPKTEDCLRVCDECKGYFSNKYFSKHKCSVKKPTPLKPTLLASADMKEIKNDPEFLDILNRFHDGKMGDLCRSNETIIMIGYRHFNLRRHENGKENEVRKVVMTEMRTLARLYSEFKEICNDTSIEDMLSRSHLEDLCTAIRSLTKTADNSEKHGLKLHVDAVVLRSIKTLKGHFSETMQDEKKTELKHFKDAYTHKSKVLYPKARQTSIRNSFEKARRPQNLPDEMELKKLKHFIEYEIKKSTQNFETSSYAYLRTLVVSRLTLFNARRGEEASRMLLTEWEDGMKSVWLPEEQVEDIEDEAVKFLIGRFKLCYLQGKGKKFVPVLVPNDLVSAINMLVKKRQEFGIAEENKHVFATKDRAGNKSSHCSGWHALNEVCKKACVTISVTATKMRHRLSTIYASLDMSASDQKIFFDHMGHEKEINKENYQCPQGIRTVQVMGKMLNNIDEGANASAIRTKSHFAGGTDETKSSVKSAEIYPQEDESGDAVQSGPNIRQSSLPGVKWSRKDTECLRKHFEELIFSADAKNKGRLPSKEEIICYLDHHEPESLKHLDLQDQYIKTRTKLFNERKTARLVIATKLKSITCSK